jgi:hypothetical protein
MAEFASWQTGPHVVVGVGPVFGSSPQAVMPPISNIESAAAAPIHAHSVFAFI